MADTVDPLVQAIVDRRGWVEGSHGKHYADEAIQASKDYLSLSKPTDVARANDKDGKIGNFDDYELLVAGVLASAWEAKAPQALAAIKDVLGDVSNLSITRVDTAFETARGIMGDLLRPADELDLKAIYAADAKRGQAMARAFNVLERNPRYAGMLEGMVDASKYYTNRYFSEQVVPQLYKTIEKALDTGLAPTSDGFREILKALDDRLLGRTPYWHTVSNAATSRAYHWGVIKAGRATGYRGYKLVAVLDRKTSAICRKLDGKEFWLADAEEIYDRAVGSGIGSIKDTHPWITGEEAKGLTEDEVYARATYVPPFHGRCRTTMQLLP